MVKTPVFYDGEAPDIRSPSPRLGQHTAEILQNLGYSQENIERLASDGIVVLGDT
jgi:crotonobetainyl-CoA:carnitine CoA-transferase CaiB-like acyl-CoA transferase